MPGAGPASTPAPAPGTGNFGAGKQPSQEYLAGLRLPAPKSPATQGVRAMPPRNVVALRPGRNRVPRCGGECRALRPRGRSSVSLTRRERRRETHRCGRGLSLPGLPRCGVPQGQPSRRRAINAVPRAKACLGRFALRSALPAASGSLSLPSAARPAAFHRRCAPRYHRASPAVPAATKAHRRPTPRFRRQARRPGRTLASLPPPSLRSAAAPASPAASRAFSPRPAAAAGRQAPAPTPPAHTNFFF